MDKNLFLASLGCIIFFTPLLLYMIKKLASYNEIFCPDKKMADKNLIKDPNILSRLLDFSAATWFVFNGTTVHKHAPNASFFLKAKHPILKVEDLKKFIKPEFQKSFSYFFQNLITKNHSFYLQVNSLSNQPMEIKAFCYQTTKTKKLYFVFLRKLPISSTNSTNKEDISNFSIIKQLVNNIAFPCWIKKQDGKILHVNKAYEEISKMKNYQIIEQNVDIVDMETDTAYAMAEARDKREIYRKKSFSVLGGLNHYLDIVERPLKTSALTSENFHLGIAINCSTESKLKNNLTRYKKSFYSLLKDFSIGIAIFNENTQLVFYNTAYANLLALGDDEEWLKSQPTMDKFLDILQQHQRLPYHPDYKKFKEERISLFKNLQKPQEEILYLPDGSVFRITISPYSTGGLFYTMENITNTLELSEKYNTLIEVLKTTVDNMYEGVAVIGEDGTFTLCNEPFHKFWKIRKNANLKGKAFIETLHNFYENFLSLENWKEHKDILLSCLSSRKKLSNFIWSKENASIIFTYTPLPNGSHLFSYLRSREKETKALF